MFHVILTVNNDLFPQTALACCFPTVRVRDAVIIASRVQTARSLAWNIQSECALVNRFVPSHSIPGFRLIAQLGLGLCETVHIYGDTSPSTNAPPSTYSLEAP